MAATAVYVRTAGYGLFADDFGWLVGAESFSPARLFDLEGRTHFYRPVIEAYFPAALAACGRSAACFHWIGIGLHALNGLIVALMAGALSRSRGLGVLAGLLFVVAPAPGEAVIWVSAVSELIVTGSFVLTVWLFARGLAESSTRLYLAALLAFAACLLSHESGVTLLPILVLVPVPSAERDGRSSSGFRARALAVAPFVVLALAYGAIAYVVNSNNYVVREGDYGPGFHLVRNVIDGVITMAVARRTTIAAVAVAAVGVGALVRGSARVRFYTLWIAITLLPFAGFRSGLTSRYLYLPSVGFAALVAEAVWWTRTPLEQWRRPAGRIVWATIVVAVLARSAAFARRNTHVWQDAATPFAEYAGAILAIHPRPSTGETLRVPQPPREIPTNVVPPLIQWTFDDPSLIVHVDGASLP